VARKGWTEALQVLEDESAEGRLMQAVGKKRAREGKQRLASQQAKGKKGKG
jgi:hypothetical protein